LGIAVVTLSIDQRRQFEQLVYASFPTEPVPHEFFWAKRESPIERDIPKELRERLAGRRWPEITLTDWRMIGTPPAIARDYLRPSTFCYYLPSLLLSVLGEPDFLEWALEALIPLNKAHEPRGKWWGGFVGAVSESQRATLRSFLTIVDPADPANQSLLSIAETIWGRDPDVA
jgi:hypothetical protein